MNGAPGNQQQQQQLNNRNFVGAGFPQPGGMPVQNHFSGPTAVYAFNQPGNYNVSINFNPRSATTANPNQTIMGQTMQHNFQQSGSSGNTMGEPAASLSSPFSVPFGSRVGSPGLGIEEKH